MKYYLLVRKGALLSLFDPRTTFSFCMEFVFMLRMHMCFSRRHVFFLRNIFKRNRWWKRLFFPNFCWNIRDFAAQVPPTALAHLFPGPVGLSPWNVERLYNFVSFLWRRSLIKFLWSGEWRRRRCYLPSVAFLSINVHRCLFRVGGGRTEQETRSQCSLVLAVSDTRIVKISKKYFPQ